MPLCKTCGCNELTAEFYASIKTYCKEHWCAMVRKNREEKIDQYKAYERSRLHKPERVAARKAYQADPKNQAALHEIHKRWQKQNPEKRAAQIALGNAVRDGRVFRWPVCSLPECDKKPQAHHPDYSRPLDVVWLCPKHHSQAHAITNLERKSA